MPGPVVDLLALPGLALLPHRIRDAYGIPWGRAESGRRRVAWAAAVRAWTTVGARGLARHAAGATRLPAGRGARPRGPRVRSRAATPTAPRTG